LAKFLGERNTLLSFFLLGDQLGFELFSKYAFKGVFNQLFDKPEFM